MSFGFPDSTQSPALISYSPSRNMSHHHGICTAAGESGHRPPRSQVSAPASPNWELTAGGGAASDDHTANPRNPLRLIAAAPNRQWCASAAASSSSAAPGVDLKALQAAIDKKDGEEVKQALDQLKELGWAKWWSSQTYVSRRTIPPRAPSIRSTDQGREEEALVTTKLLV
ncbi:hypothetical protein E2562_023772 [Oryza meyeriana var. granulata]|uniref:Uncharacterized protein n=1 Tax=Oryza meyeriana var. granulata TaxID=110450 RepID=A0A6G1DNK9_9ORYZ|nr:hypothetical protein E2562_023772 [Oryza meyeriana var. granulata]KAF0913675.1 hypothetical protein E2562_023772 [Oryza meyeriana var. granulata]